MIFIKGFSPDWLWKPWSRKYPTFFQSASVGWWSELIKNPGRNKNIIIWLYETHFNGIRLVGGVGGVEGGILATAETHGADGTLLQLAKRNQLFIKPSLAMWVWVYFEIFQCFNEFWYQQTGLRVTLIDCCLLAGENKILYCFGLLICEYFKHKPILALIPTLNYKYYLNK